MNDDDDGDDVDGTPGQSHKKTSIKIYNSPAIINNTARDKSIKSIRMFVGGKAEPSPEAKWHASDIGTMAGGISEMQRDTHSKLCGIDES